jgi:hypothetical protein
MPELVPRQRKAVLARLALQAAIRNEADLIAMLPPEPPAASAKRANRISIFLRSCPASNYHPFSGPCRYTPGGGFAFCA